MLRLLTSDSLPNSQFLNSFLLPSIANQTAFIGMDPNMTLLTQANPIRLFAAEFGVIGKRSLVMHDHPATSLIKNMPAPLAGVGITSAALAHPFASAALLPLTPFASCAAFPLRTIPSSLMRPHPSRMALSIAELVCLGLHPIRRPYQCGATLSAFTVHACPVRIVSTGLPVSPTSPAAKNMLASSDHTRFSHQLRATLSTLANYKTTLPSRAVLSARPGPMAVAIAELVLLFGDLIGSSHQHRATISTLAGREATIPCRIIRPALPRCPTPLIAEMMLGVGYFAG